MSIAKIVLISAENTVARAVSKVVGSIRDCQLRRADTVSRAFSRVGYRDDDLLLVCVDHSGCQSDLPAFLRDNAKAKAPIAVIVITENPDPELKLSLLEMKVVDCLSTPLDLQRLAFLVDVLTMRVRHGQSSSVEVRQVQPQPPLAVTSDSTDRSFVPNGSVFVGCAMQAILKQCRALAPLETTILITGETGTGKTYLARLIHDLSPRKTRPFLNVSCGALTSSLVTSELFGHVRGAFTGAETDQVGKLVAAEEGTVLLDDIDCLALETQAKLLRALDDRVVEPVGSNRPQRLRARLIVASNRPLDEEVKAGRLREDLYYRINVANLVLPPLREQPQMIPLLVEKFLAEFRRCHGRAVEAFTPNSLALLEAYSWPGNIRQLRNVIERALVMASGTVLDVEDLPEAIRLEGQTMQHRSPCAKISELDRSKDAAELSRLVEALRHQQNNRRRAAEELGVSRVTLYKKLHHYDLI